MASGQQESPTAHKQVGYCIVEIPIGFEWVYVCLYTTQVKFVLTQVSIYVITTIMRYVCLLDSY